ncbi:DUF262 domain-containing protein [Bacillus atrophaeus]|uniref:DUF262 domain-containing protein n=2 Tax=Bacillus atrophaeus TaxID=1452 RepID=UPI002281666A|nr:DUF262 domain-containing protein [Bacillus atrophaeus]MCY9168901.1 DUF262 domain-containing protein [Bacillus atrophaeus]MEC0739750.1 DUF262 domain-containing protein [Bacillus atrophaeus]MEC0746584.1 DUF262 domain-containing protein [Bacillus atrophaeus]MEC0760044.1 DUF262 domain-containing protein [Bacillus atrophaeus]MEC0912863.1 DUF262 domain-containing protein [Bacillus atrophaeus]
MLNKINYKPQDIAIKDIISMITNGFELQKLDKEEELDDEVKLDFTDSIIIAPDYQRNYRASIVDESSLIESILLGIPIPPIFLANDRYEGVKVLNVVDGQHRLRAFHRFKENKFKLSGLTILVELNGKKFNECAFEVKEKILSHKLASIVFTDFPGLDFELEIFSRYNKGTKPLTQQDIRHAVYNSKLNSFVNKFAQKMNDQKVSNKIQRAYNATTDRVRKKKIQENIFVIMSILENGLNQGYAKSSVYAEEYMKQKSKLEVDNPTQSDIDYDKITARFNEFNEIIELVGEKIEHPFSKEIYGVSSKGYKFQITIAMILSGIIHKIINESIPLTRLKNTSQLNEFLTYVSDTLKNSYLEDPKFNASSTNARAMNDLISKLNFDFLKSGDFTHNNKF